MLALIDRRHMIMNINKGIAQLTLFHQQEQVQSVGSFSLKKNDLFRTEKSLIVTQTNKQYHYPIKRDHDLREHIPNT